MLIYVNTLIFSELSVLTLIKGYIRVVYPELIFNFFPELPEILKNPEKLRKNSFPTVFSSLFHYFSYIYKKGVFM